MLAVGATLRLASGIALRLGARYVLGGLRKTAAPFLEFVASPVLVTAVGRCAAVLHVRAERRRGQHH